MKIFHCGKCQGLLFFENVQCLACKHPVAYLPDMEEVASLDAAGQNLWRTVPAEANGPTYRLCLNYNQDAVCNWAVPADDPNPLCPSCRLTRVIPNLSQPRHLDGWRLLETAKRRLIYTLLSLKLPLMGKGEAPEKGLSFEFLADPEKPGAPAVLTGHNNGVITVNIAEADASVREKRRHQMHEGYRTLLGHFRHEIGHYYWDLLVRDSRWIEDYRKWFGDERQSYDEALKRHYKEGSPADWQARFISAYASSHPWEDWAETWAHYLHMTDTMETAIACGLSLRPKRSDEPALKLGGVAVGPKARSFDALIENWFPLTYVLNNLNRGMGLPDAYPFVLSDPAIEKMRFIHEVIVGASERP
jgi:hypothetical protein